MMDQGLGSLHTQLAELKNFRTDIQAQFQAFNRNIHDFEVQTINAPRNCTLLDLAHAAAEVEQRSKKIQDLGGFVSSILGDGRSHR